MTVESGSLQTERIQRSSNVSEKDVNSERCEGG